MTEQRVLSPRLFGRLIVRSRMSEPMAESAGSPLLLLGSTESPCSAPCKKIEVHMNSLAAPRTYL